MFILFVLFGLVVGLWIVNSRMGAKIGPYARCEKQHKWVIRFENNDKRGYLVCSACGKIPGND